MVEAPFRRVMIIGHTDPRKRGTQTVQTHDLLGTIFGHHGQPPALCPEQVGGLHHAGLGHQLLLNMHGKFPEHG